MAHAEPVGQPTTRSLASAERRRGMGAWVNGVFRYILGFGENAVSWAHLLVLDPHPTPGLLLGSPVPLLHFAFLTQP